MKTVYCPYCGKPMTIDGIQKLPRGEQIQVTCRDNPTCKVRRYTTTVQSISDGLFQSTWGFKSRFDYETGVQIDERPSEN